MTGSSPKVGRLVWDQEDAGSSPVFPTTSPVRSVVRMPAFHAGDGSSNLPRGARSALGGAIGSAAVF